MNEIVQIMLLPPLVDGGFPQVLLEDSGTWRATNSLVAASLADTRNQIEAHLSDVMKEVDGHPPEQVPAHLSGFKSPFEAHYKKVLPTELHDALRKASKAADEAGGARPTLQVHLMPGWEWIPWELFHDGTSFIGLRFAVARLPILQHPLNVGGVCQRQVSSVYSLLGNGVLHDDVFEEWKTTFAGYGGPGLEKRYPSNGTDYPSLDQWEETAVADIVHVTCHGGLKDEKSNIYYWTLNDKINPTFNYRIYPDRRSSLEWTNGPLVFGNACTSDTAQKDGLGAMQGFGVDFMIAGALNFVGTFAPITKTMAVRFAREFYQQLLGTPGGAAGVAIAHALLETKRSFFNDKCPDPSYLFYCLYGPPSVAYSL